MDRPGVLPGTVLPRGLVNRLDDGDRAAQGEGRGERVEDVGPDRRDRPGERGLPPRDEASSVRRGDRDHVDVVSNLEGL